ncbi:transcriptional regulator [Bacteroidia bacterium]|nr:transcriptional regulator [Bacteroidia bacterium]
MKHSEIKALIERGKDGTYGVYVDLNENKLTYGIIGDGATVQEAMDDFRNSYEEMKSYYADEGKPFEEVEFKFDYDMPSFLNYYSNVITLAGLGRLTGVNPYQLSHYATGHRRPRPAMVKKIETSLHNFSKELSHVHFSV